MPSFARRRLLALAAVALALVLSLGVLVLDAQARVREGRAERERTARIARVTGLSELALSTSSTWLRHPALAAPAEATSGATLGLDQDPAGAVIARPALRREGAR